MARTFSYQKSHRNHQQPPLRSSWRSNTKASTKRGKYADNTDRSHEHCRSMVNRQTDKANETAERQKRPASL